MQWVWPEVDRLEPVIPPLLVVPRVHGQRDSAQIDVPPDDQAMADARLKHFDLNGTTGVVWRQAGVVKLETEKEER